MGWVIPKPIALEKASFAAKRVPKYRRARSGDRVRVNAQLIDPQSGQQLWTENYERNASDVLRLQSELTRAIAGEIRVKLNLALGTSVTAWGCWPGSASARGRWRW